VSPTEPGWESAGGEMIWCGSWCYRTLWAEINSARGESKRSVDLLPRFPHGTAGVRISQFRGVVQTQGCRIHFIRGVGKYIPDFFACFRHLPLVQRQGNRAFRKVQFAGTQQLQGADEFGFYR
jgi:hypothetical protein